MNHQEVSPEPNPGVEATPGEYTVLGNLRLLRPTGKYKEAAERWESAPQKLDQRNMDGRLYFTPLFTRRYANTSRASFKAYHEPPGVVRGLQGPRIGCLEIVWNGRVRCTPCPALRILRIPSCPSPEPTVYGVELHREWRDGGHQQRLHRDGDGFCIHGRHFAV